MAQVLKYVIGKDYRPLTVLEAKGGNTFTPDYNKDNWVQARQYEDSLRQVFVEITNEDGSAYDLTGANVLFEGILPDNEHKILDNSHVVFYEDPTTGKFRFDMPAQAFSVAGQYKQAFFRVVKNYRNIATLEFKFEVLADMVVTGLVPRDYISPLEEFFNAIKDEQTKDSAELKKIVDDKVAEITNLMTALNTANASTLAELGTARNSLLDIEKKIQEDGLFTQYQADQYKQNFDKKVNDINKKIDDGFADINTKIEQANKDNTSLVENKLTQIDTNVHAYSNIDAIKEAYPKGALGIFVAVDTGHQWYYLGDTWTDGGVYQASSSTTDGVKAQTSYLFPDFANGSNISISQKLSEYTFNFTGNRYIGIYNDDSQRYVKTIYIQVDKTLKLTESSALVYNATTNSVTVQAWTSDKFPNNLIILALNYYGTLYGQWAAFFDRTPESIKSTAGLFEAFPLVGNNIEITRADDGEHLNVKFIVKNTAKNFSVLNTNSIGNKTDTGIANGTIYTLDNYDYLIFNFDSNAIEKYPYDHYTKYILNKSKHKILIYNYYGYAYGDWAKYQLQKQQIDNIQNTVSLLSNGIPPKYYFDNNYLQNKIKEINDINSFINGVSFFFITDPHFYSNAGNSDKLINYIQGKTGIELTLHGGDMIRAYGSIDDIKTDVASWNSWKEHASKIVLAVSGNHDLTIKKSDHEVIGYTLSDGYKYNAITRHEETLPNIVLAGAGKNYWYADNKQQKTRFIGLDVFEMRNGNAKMGWEDNYGAKTEQLKWLVNTALKVEDNWKIVIMQHCPIDPNMEGVTPQVNPVWNILSAYQNKNKVTITNIVDDTTSFDVDFTQSKGKIILDLSGHQHVDNETYNNGILSINTLCDAYYNDDPNYTKNRSIGTINEQAFDVVSIDYDNEIIYCVRIGAGASEIRKYNFSGQELK